MIREFNGDLTNVLPTLTLSEGFVEAIYERTQDNARSGYQNLGSGADRSFTVSGSGDLFINGQGGDDEIFAFAAGNHTVHAGSGNDAIHSGEGNDNLTGGSGNDTIISNFGDDTLAGGSGSDELWGGAGTDVLHGGSGNDILRGDHDGSATAQQGNDTLKGGGGSDNMSGGGGADEIWGGFGADIFQVDHQNDLTRVASTSDRFMDFSRADGDMIDLRLIDANLNASGNQAFRLATTTAQQSEAGRMWFGTTNTAGEQQVFLNLDGGAFDEVITVKFNDATMTSLSATDFFL